MSDLSTATISDHHVQLLKHREPTEAEEAAISAEIKAATIVLRAAHLAEMEHLKGRGYVYRPNAVSRVQRRGRSVGAE